MEVLAPFEARFAPTILGWVGSPEEASRWARADLSRGTGLFAEWHRDPDVHPFVFLVDGRLAGYGEVWHDDAAQEAELARILVRPDVRGQGIGRRLVTALADRARRDGFARIWLRVVPDNAPAIACYRSAGFVRAEPPLEAEFNVGQPLAYVWLRRARE